MKIKASFFVLLNLISTISFAETSIPINQIVELDEFDYLVSMIKDEANSIGYRTYPFAGIDAPGFYKLANNVSNQISINVNDVILDMGGHTVSGGLVIGNNLENITVKNGTVDVNSALANAIIINSGCKNIKLESIAARNATTNGININGLRDSIIKNCEMTQNATGLLLCNSSNIMVDDTISSRNLTEGFCLVSSVTCSFRRCKAINTGLGNTMATSERMGFVTDNGFGNVFDSCIAQGTNGGSVTSWDIAVAGFMFKNDERCSSIINCEASNTVTNPTGQAIPYGIYLQETIDNPMTLTASPSIPDLFDTSVNAVRWSPDGKYLAVGLASSDAFRLRIFSFDRNNLIVSQVATPDIIPANAVIDLNWTLDSRFLVMSTSSAPRLAVYEFDRTNNTLIQVASVAESGTGRRARWRNDGRFITYIQQNSGIKLYEFNRISKTLTLRDTQNSFSGQSSVYATDWSPDGKFALTGSFNAIHFNLFEFKEDTKTLRLIEQLGSDRQIWDVAWSPDGNLILAATPVSGTGTIKLLSYDRLTSTLLQEHSLSRSSNVRCVQWAPNGKYGVDCQLANATQTVTVVQIDRDTLTLSVASLPNESSGAHIFASSWSPDGKYIASGGADGLFIFRIMSKMERNVVKNNTVYCNTGNITQSDFPLGAFGISASGISNLVVGNTCYSNPVNSSILDLNYVFVPNVFNPLFQDAPTAEQNIGPSQYDPICAPPDQVLMLTQLNSKLCDIQTKIDLIIAANP